MKKLYQCLDCFNQYRLDINRFFQRSCKAVRSDSKRMCGCGLPAKRVRVLLKLKPGMAVDVAGQQQLTTKGARTIAKGHSVLSQQDRDTKLHHCVQCGKAGLRRRSHGVLTRWAYCQGCWDKHLESRREFTNRTVVAFNRTRPKDTEVYVTATGQKILDKLYTDQVEGKGS